MAPTKVDRRAELASTSEQPGMGDRLHRTQGRGAGRLSPWRRPAGAVRRRAAERRQFPFQPRPEPSRPGRAASGAEARASFAKAQALGEAIVAEVPTVPRYRSDLAMTLMLAGNLARNLKDYDEAIALQREGRRPRRGVGTRPPGYGPVSARSGQ